MAEKSQADLDQLAAQIAPGPVQDTKAHVIQASVQGSTAGPKASVAGNQKVDPFAEVEIEFRRQQLAKEAAHAEKMRQIALEKEVLLLELAKEDLEDKRE